MARYSLRNQKKISDVLGKSELNKMLSSLNTYFANAEYIEVYREGPHDTIKCKTTDGTLEFYLLSKKYDVYNLAFKSK